MTDALSDKEQALIDAYRRARVPCRSARSYVYDREERPVCGERTEGCWAQNRRAHFLVKVDGH